MDDVLNTYLENGLKVVFHKIPNAQIVSCGAWIRQGSKYENDADHGLSHLAEHLLLNPRNESEPDYQRIMDSVSREGVLYNAATTKEYTCFYFTGLTQTLEICLAALAQLVKNNRKFDKQFYENEKKVVLQEASVFYASIQQIKERTSQALWGNTGIGRIVVGNTAIIAEAKQEQMKQLLENAYVPENAEIVVIGDFDYAKTLCLVEEKFGDWKNVKCMTREQEVQEKPGVYLNCGSGTNAVISLGFRGPAYHGQNRPAVDMLVRLLGNSGLQSRLVREIRMKRGLSYNLGGYSSFYEKCSTLGFMTACDKTKAVEVMKIMAEVLREAKDNGFSEEEIEREKKGMETSLLLSAGNMIEHIRLVGRCGSMNHEFLIDRELRDIRKLRKEEVENAAKEFLREDKMGLAVIGTCDFDKLMDAAALD